MSTIEEKMEPISLLRIQTERWNSWSSWLPLRLTVRRWLHSSRHILYLELNQVTNGLTRKWTESWGGDLVVTLEKSILMKLIFREVGKMRKRRNVQNALGWGRWVSWAVNVAGKCKAECTAALSLLLNVPNHPSIFGLLNKSIYIQAARQMAVRVVSPRQQSCAPGAAAAAVTAQRCGKHTVLVRLLPFNRIVIKWDRFTVSWINAAFSLFYIWLISYKSIETVKVLKVLGWKPKFKPLCLQW